MHFAYDMKHFPYEEANVAFELSESLYDKIHTN